MNVNPELIMLGASWSAQIIGLLSVWKQERSESSDDHYKDFMVWLANHNFTELSLKIHNSEEINRELHGLLSQSLEQIDAKLDSISNALSRLAAKVEGLGGLDRAVQEEAKGLSSQAQEILKLATDTKTAFFFPVHHDRSNPYLFFMPMHKGFTFDEPLYLEEDLESLVAADLVILSDYTDDGSPMYKVTRKGSALAEKLPSVVINDPEAG